MRARARTRTVCMQGCQGEGEQEGGGQPVLGERDRERKGMGSDGEEKRTGGMSAEGTRTLSSRPRKCASSPSKRSSLAAAAGCCAAFGAASVNRSLTAPSSRSTCELSASSAAASEHTERGPDRQSAASARTELAAWQDGAGGVVGARPPYVLSEWPPGRNFRYKRTHGVPEHPSRKDATLCP